MDIKEIKRMAIEYTPQELRELIEDNNETQYQIVADKAYATLVYLGEEA